MIIPDKSWYVEESKKRSAMLACPYANAHKCPRYYESIVLLSRISMISGIPSDKMAELDFFWKGTNFSALCEEEVPSITQSEYGQLHSVSNFCPEVSFKYLFYYADYMHKYADGIDKDFGHERAEREKLENDWRYTWSIVRATFYLDCELYERVKKFNEELGSNYLSGLHPNIVLQVSRMDTCLDNGDATGALHAAANILETMAKEITANPKVANETLGSFFEQYKKLSSLPEKLKEAVLEIYKLRNTTPTSGHGSLQESNLTLMDAISIAAMTKVTLEIEYRAKHI